ncbi:hypothetical protein GOP47_0006987 [Adiantum capillus-veneris]|uniref:Uncharacterized protein n=1 Tax=Adiantum capillus-veneris TaxID=13818 RepID=A0A9D4V0Q5_ADICA|nr:hypothetical protein GOP47_0006987 [Adiantum capillus-veneris]
MNAETVLDFVELQLAPPRTRCELFVSANGVTEKVASGFLKPFRTHLRAVEEQTAKGCSLVRLGYPQFMNGKSWFTKGTVERFVRFVSTPEVLERVKSVEDELAQLEQVRSIQASSLFQADDIVAAPAEVPIIADDNVHPKVSEKRGSVKLTRRNDGGLAGCGAEASKVELLKAMDSRVHALQQEQSTAFDRAIAAGFNSETIEDLIAFSEHFGAERLRTACVNFMEVLKTRHGKYRELETKGGSGCTNMLLHSVPNHDEISRQRLDVDMSKASHESEDERVEYREKAFIPAVKGTGLNCRGSGGVEVRKRWGPPENIRTEMFMNQNETDSASSCGSSNGASIRSSPEIQSSLKKTNIEEDMHQKANLLHSLLCKNVSPKAQGENALSAGHVSSKSTQSQADGNIGDSLSAERCPMSFQSIQSNSLVPNCKVSSQEVSVKAKSRDVNLSSTSGEGDNCKDSGLSSETLSIAVVEPNRRLSVQDAISLFETKQRRDSLDSAGKHRSCKQENDRASFEGGTSLSGSVAALKRWDSGKRPETGSGLWEIGFSSKPEVAVLDGECSFHASASRPVGSGTPPSHSLQGIHGDSSDQNISGTLANMSSNTQSQSSIQCVSAKAEGTNDGQSAPSEIVTGVCDGDWRKQFKLQLEKSLAKDCFTRDLVVGGDLQANELGINMSNKILNRSDIDLATTPFVGSRSREAIEIGTCVEARQVLPILGPSHGNTSRLQNGSENSESGFLNSKRAQAMAHKVDCETTEVVKPLVTSDYKRESLGSSSVISLDHDMHSLFLLADYQTSEDDKGSDGSKGRLYEQYRKLRDAKLMEDQDSKRAERETRLKIMEETLRRRKAEMDARVVRLSKNTRNQACNLKVEALESGLHTQKQDGDVEDTKSAGKDQAKSTGSSASPPSTPCTSKEVPTSKPQGGRKTGTVSQKGATPPRSSNRSIPSVSPKVTPKSMTVGAGNLGKSMDSSRGDNPLARSVPCFANLRKENTKPSPGRPLGSARVHPKNGGTGRALGIIDTPPLEANGNVRVRPNFSRVGPIKEEKKIRSAVLRKSYATMNDLKALSTSSDDGILAPRKGQKETTAEPAAYNKLRRSAIGSLQEAKPFLRKGRGIGPGTGPGMMKQKVSSTTDTTKSSDEDRMPSQKPEENDNIHATGAVFAGSVSKELSESENMDIGDDAPVNFALPNDANEHSMRTLNISESNNEADTHTPSGPLLGTMNDIKGATHTISSPIDIETHDGFAEVLSTQSDSDLKIDPDALSQKEEDIEAFSDRDDDTVGSIQTQLDEASACASFRAVSPSHEHHSISVSSPVPPSPPSSSLTHQERFSPSIGAKFESPMGSPAAWISLQVQHTEITHLDKKWAAFMKPVVASQPKESVKGFKRLLKFGRRSRSSEAAAADCISASTTSEGDDESEEQSRFVEEISNRGLLFERRYNDVLRDHNQAEEGGSAQLLRSSIPTPPANFKMRDDHMGGGTMLRAPRSFFSLSSFRSKGSDGRLRSREHGHG